MTSEYVTPQGPPPEPATSEVRQPPRRLLGVLACIGPGIVVIGSVMGSGELINTPAQAAKFGIVLLWAVILACLIKFFLQVEFGRHALVHGRTPFQAFNSLPGLKIKRTSWIGLLYMGIFVFTALTLPGMMTAIAGMLSEIIPVHEWTGIEQKSLVRPWAILVAFLTWLVLFRGYYDSMEKLITLLVLVFSVSAVVGLVLVQFTSFRITGAEFVSGLTFSLGDDRQGAAVAVIALMGGLGATSNELFMYPYWVLEKGYGQHVGNPDSEGFVERARGWIRVLQWDTGVCTILATVITAALFVMAAAVLYDSGTDIDKDTILVQFSAMFSRTFGDWSVIMFYVGAFCMLFSTLIVGIAAAGRMWADMFASMGKLDLQDPVARRRCHRWVELAYVLVCCGFVLFSNFSPAQLVVFGQYVAGLFGTPVLMLAICWLAFRTDKRVRMNWLSAVFLILSMIVIAACLFISTAVQKEGMLNLQLQVLLGTVISAIGFLTARWLYNQMAGSPDDPRAIPKPRFGGLIAIAFVSTLVHVATGQAGLLLALITPDTGFLWANLAPLPVSLLASAGMIRALLPTTFRKSMGVAIFQFIIGILLGYLVTILFSMTTTV